MDATDEIRPRQIKQSPFCWQHKGTLKMIRNVFENGHGIAAIPISVYVSMSELASDAHSETFTAPIMQIALRAGASYRTTAKILNRFESMKLIRVQRNSVRGTKEHAPSTYTMLGTPCLTLGKHEASCLPKMMNNTKKKKKISPPNPPLSSSTPTPSDNGKPTSSCSFFVGHQHQPIQNHVKWPEYAAWCRSKGGKPTEKGFWTWWGKQKSQWRNKVKKAFDEIGYELNGKFLTSDEANRLGRENPDSLTKFRKAVRRDGKIEIIHS
jgi:hypothetical protein